MKSNTPVERLYNGIIKENPTFVMMLGMCPTLAVTTGAINAVGMGLSTMAVLVLSNLIISLLRKIIPNGVRVPAFIVIVASLVTVVQFLLQAFVPSVYESLGIYIPLIVVNCIILGRAEAYASKSPVIPSVFDGIGMGIGFTVGLFCLGIFREVIGAGTIFNIQVMPKGYEGATLFIMAPGAFLVLAFLTLLQNKALISAKKKADIKASEAKSAEPSMKRHETCAGCVVCGLNTPTVAPPPAPKPKPAPKPATPAVDKPAAPAADKPAASAAEAKAADAKPIESTTAEAKSEAVETKVNDNNTNEKKEDEQ